MALQVQLRIYDGRGSQKENCWPNIWEVHTSICKGGFLDSLAEDDRQKLFLLFREPSVSLHKQSSQVRKG